MLAHSPHQIQDKELPAEIHPMAFLYSSAIKYVRRLPTHWLILRNKV